MLRVGMHIPRLRLGKRANSSGVATLFILICMGAYWSYLGEFPARKRQ